MITSDAMYRLLHSLMGTAGSSLISSRLAL